MPVAPWAVYGDSVGKESRSVTTCCFTVTPPTGPPSLAAIGGVPQPALREARHRQRQQKQQQQPISEILKEALEDFEDDEEAEGASGSRGSTKSRPTPMSVVVPPVFGRYPYDSAPASAAELPSILLRCTRAEEHQGALLLAAAAAVAAAMRQQLEGICRIVRTHAAVGALELLQRSSSGSSSGTLCEFLPVVIMHVGADVEDHRLAVRMLQLELQQQAKCCCGGRRIGRTSRNNSTDAELFLRQVVLRASNCTNPLAALRAVYGQLKGSSCCSTCIGRSSSKAEKECLGDASLPEELATDAAAAAAWGEPRGFYAQQQLLLLLQSLEGVADDSTAAQGAVRAADEEDGGYVGHDVSSRIGQLWKRQLQKHNRGFCCSWRSSGEGGAVRTRSQRVAATVGSSSSSSSSESSASEDNSDDDVNAAAIRTSSSSSSVLVVVLEELESFAPRVLSQLLLLLAVLRVQQGVPVLVLASAAASAVAVQQLLDPTALRLLQIDAAVLLRPSAVHDALLQLLLCCPASAPFVLPAAAIEELQELLLDQGASVLQLLRVLKMLLYKFFAEHPFSFLSVGVRSVVRGSHNRLCSSQEAASASDADAASPGDFVDFEALERRLALLAAAVLTPHQEAALLQQMSKFPLLYAELLAVAPSKLELPCCKATRSERQQQQHRSAPTGEGCIKIPTCGAIARASAVLQQWWGSPAVSAVAEEQRSTETRRKILQQQVLPVAALQVLERRVAASLAMRLLVILQQHVLQQRQAFALSAAETAAALSSTDSGSSALPAVNLLLQILGGYRTPGYHDYLLQGKAVSSAAATRIVSLICEEVRRVAGACCRVGGLVTTLVSEALNAAATTACSAAVPNALLGALYQFSRQSRREWAVLQQLESRLQLQYKVQQPTPTPAKAAELFKTMNKLINVLQQACEQQLQRGHDVRPGFISGLGRRASTGTASFAKTFGTTVSRSSSGGEGSLCSRFQDWARDCLQHFLLPLPQWHPLGCELGVWSLSCCAAEQPQYLAAALAVPRVPHHRAEAGAADALARLHPLRPAEVLQQLACLNNSALEYHQQAGENELANAGKASVVPDDSGLLYRRIAFGTRRISLWTLFCSFCADLIETYIQNQPHLKEQRQEQQAKQQGVASAKARGRRGKKGSSNGDCGEGVLEGKSSSDRLPLELKALQDLQTEAETGVSERSKGSPTLLLHQIFLRFGVALGTLEHLGLVRLPGSGVSADDLLLRSGEAGGADADGAEPTSDIEQAGNSEVDSDEERGPAENIRQHQGSTDDHPSGTRKKRSRKVAPALSEAMQLQQQLQGLYLTRCFFGSVYLPEHQEEPKTSHQLNGGAEQIESNRTKQN
ncbi:uncharacterized protein LOC34622798 [Cyclospora cayetanensis]|uniref:Uncharacterized protein LOC34622798 n=1 Tax=Cyclospora cayetanensis TaxID=88456 RepID=A0A6P6S004_9EIME|nr:uncharacterized protein LOC34622798 [Cyclospora cayetanensis]